MTNDGDKPAAPHDWDAARLSYWKRTSLASISKRLKLPLDQLQARAKAEGWKKKEQDRKESTGRTIRRLKDLLQQRLADLESQLAAISEGISAAESEREIKSINTLVRTLEKVLELERKHSAGRRRGSGALRIVDSDRRMELAKRIAALSGTWRDPRDPQPTDDSGV